MQNKKNTWFDKIKDVLGDSPKAKEDLLELLKNSALDGVIDIESLKMIEGVFKVSEVQVREIMIPRSHITVVDISDDISDIIKKVTSSGHSRFPVIDDNKDEIIGVLLAKDLLKRNSLENNDLDLHEVLRPAVFVPESKRLNILLNEFKSSRNHIAIVIDEHGSVSGLITIEDVLEEIVGEIDDEHDEETVSKIISRGNNQYIVDALTTLEEFNSYFLSNFDDEVETIGGFLINKFEKVPKNSETILIEKLSFKILSADSRSIKRIQVIRTTNTE